MKFNNKEKSLLSGIFFGFVIIILYISFNYNLNIYYIVLSFSIFIISSFLLFFRYFDEKYSYIFHFIAGILMVLASLIIYILFFQDGNYVGGIISTVESVLSFFGMYLLLNSIERKEKREIKEFKGEIENDNEGEEDGNVERDENVENDFEDEFNRIDRL
ncbi:MAG: hypothetical protein ACP5IB_03120 [Thermoplasmata archaeon]